MAAKKNSLVENINRKKRAGTSRPKSRSTISADAYADMQRGWPRKKKKASKKRKTRGVAARKRPQSPATARKTTGRKATARKATARKATARKATTRKAPARKATRRKSTTRRTASRSKR